MVRRGGRCKEGGKSRENFLYGSLASAKQERRLFNRVCSQPCGRRVSPEGKGGSESPDFSRPGAADPGCPNPDPWSLRGSAQDGRSRVSWRHRDAGRGWGEEERGDLAALGRALSQRSRWRRHPGHGWHGSSRAGTPSPPAGGAHPAGQEAPTGRQHLSGDSAERGRPHCGAGVRQGRCSQNKRSGSSLPPGDVHRAVQEGPRPRLDGQQGRGHGRRLHFRHVIIQVGEEAQPDGVGSVLALEDAQVPDNFGETLAETDASVIHGQSPGIQEAWRERTWVTVRQSSGMHLGFTTLSNALCTSLEALCCPVIFPKQAAKRVSQGTGACMRVASVVISLG